MKIKDNYPKTFCEENRLRERRVYCSSTTAPFLYSYSRKGSSTIFQFVKKSQFKIGTHPTRSVLGLGHRPTTLKFLHKNDHVNRKHKNNNNNNVAVKLMFELKKYKDTT
jgi:hypothetical protein